MSVPARTRELSYLGLTNDVLGEDVAGKLTTSYQYLLDALSSDDATGKVNEMLTEKPKVRNDVRSAMQNTFKSKAAKDTGWSRGDYDWVNGRPQVHPPAPVVEAPASGAVQEEPVMPGEGPVMPEGDLWSKTRSSRSPSSSRSCDAVAPALGF